MTDFNQFIQDNWMLFSTWFVVASALLIVQLKLAATGPKSIGPQLLTSLVNRQEGVIIDIRGVADFNKGHIHGALNIPLSKVKDGIKDLEKYQTKPIIMVCANGLQVAAACAIMKKSGFEQVYKLAGGMASWVGDNLPVVK